MERLQLENWGKLNTLSDLVGDMQKAKDTLEDVQAEVIALKGIGA